jgi:methylamine dehydrogenase accessory protein MauD
MFGTTGSSPIYSVLEDVSRDYTNKSPMSKAKTDTLLILLMGIVILLMLANLGLFIRMNQLQNQIAQAIEAFQRSEPTYLPIGTKAPVFNLPDNKGKMVSLQEYLGQPVMLIFSSMSCPACEQMYHELKVAHEAHPEVMLISYGSEEENRELYQSEGLGVPILSGGREAFEAYQVNRTPSFFFIDTEGEITDVGNPLRQIEELLQSMK